MPADWQSFAANLTDAQKSQLMAMSKMTDLVGTSFWSEFPYYLGYSLTLLGLFLIMTVLYANHGRQAVTVVSFNYAIMFHMAGRYVWMNWQSPIFGGLLLTISIVMVPTMIASLDPYHWNIFSHGGRSVSIAMELATMATAALYLYMYPGFTFFVSVIGLAVWCFSVDILRKVNPNASWLEVRRVSQVIGLLTLQTAYGLEQHYPQVDYAYWLYWFGMTTFWTSLTMEDSGNAFKRFLYGVLNIGLVGAWLYTDRFIFIFYGVCGILLYECSSRFNRGNWFYWHANQADAAMELCYVTVYQILLMGMGWYLQREGINTPLVDVSFWSFLFGATMFWGYMTFDVLDVLANGTDEARALWSVPFNILYMALVFVCQRMIFFICGWLGLVIYILRLFGKYFNNVILFPIMVVLLGISTMWGFYSMQKFIAS